MNSEKLIFLIISLVTAGILAVIILSSFKKNDNQDSLTLDNGVSVSAVDLLGNNPNSKGNSDSVLKIIEFSDFECPYCKRMEPVLKDIINKYPHDVEIVYKHFPLISIHKGAYSASLASEAASKQGRFWDYHDRLFDEQPAFSEVSLISYAEELGLNVDQFNKDRKSSEISSKVKKDMALAKKLKIPGTPTFFFVYQNTVESVNLKSKTDFISSVDILVDRLKKDVVVNESTESTRDINANR